MIMIRRKYSLVYLDAKGRRVLGYDNAEGKGHHKHEGGIEVSVKFDSLGELEELFLTEVRASRGDSDES